MLISTNYSERPVDQRMVDLIKKNFFPCRKILDLGCGSGLYGRFLKKFCQTLVGFDFDQKLCEQSRQTGFYDQVIQGDIRNLDQFNIKDVDAVFCSEVLEHLTLDECSEVVSKVEKLGASRLVFTVPNPLSPHFKFDPTHCLKYSIFSLKHLLNKSFNYSYHLLPLGFSDFNKKQFIFRLLNIFATRLSLFSPTVLYLGNSKVEKKCPVKTETIIDGPLVSVIVPTRNSARTLEPCLRSIKEQTHPVIEIIVVDRDSVDSTKDTAKLFANICVNYGPERSAQRNQGVRLASGEYVLIIDSDMVLMPRVIQECVEVMADLAVASVVIPEESFGKGFWAKCKKLERSFYLGVSFMEGARFFRTKDFLSVGGYDENLVSGEDWELAGRLEMIGRVGRTREFIKHDEGHPHLFSILRKKFYYATEFRKYMKKNNNGNKIEKQTSILSRYGLFFRDINRLFANPVVGIGMLFMKTCEFLCGGLGYGFASVKAGLKNFELK